MTTFKHTSSLTLILLSLTLSPSLLLAQSANPGNPLTSEIDSHLTKVFEGVVPQLEEALGLVDKHKSLPRRTYIYGDDQKSNLNKINTLLDEAIQTLGLSQLNDTRNHVRQLEHQIQSAHNDIADYRRQRITAPKAQTQTLIDKVNPFTYTKAQYDTLISEAQTNITDWETQLDNLKEAFAKELRAIGIDVDADAADSLLASVSGDDFVTMSVVFNNVKLITEQLQTLTDQSAESLNVAKRYYGMYVVLVRVLDRVQKNFVLTINNQHLPRLKLLAKQAEANAKNAEYLLNQGGNKDILTANIKANKTTQKAADHYIFYLKQQSELIEYENTQIEKNLATAVNTYETVKLSSDVASLIQAGRKNFETLMQLRLPYLREFRNEVMNKEFKRMTQSLIEVN